MLKQIRNLDRKYIFHYLCVAVAILASSANLNANIINCYDGVNADPTTLRAAACATQATFSSSATDFLDWGALGSSLLNTYDPSANSNNPWQAVSNGGMTVGLNIGPGFSGNSTLERVDNGFLYNSGGSWIPIPVTLASRFDGHFNSVPNAGSGTPYGDHLVGFNRAQGPLLIQFSSPIASIGFNISTKVTFAVDATVRAYSVANPTSSDIPILSYRVTDTGGGGAAGSCPGLYQTPPVPCNDAPFLAVESSTAQIRSVVISSTDDRGFYIDSLFIGAEGPSTVPEPAAGLLIGGGLLAFGIVSQKYRARAR